MITLFENITEQLTELEKKTLVPALINLLKLHTNKDLRFTGRQLCGWFEKNGYQVSQIRLCKMTSYIRQLNLVAPMVLIGSGNGYFITGDVQIIQDQIDSLQGRVDALNAVIDSLKAQKQSIDKSTR